MSSQTIICGVTCDCAPKQSSEASSATACDAKSSCKLAGTCSCGDGVCLASQAKQSCAMKGSCDCKAGQCKAVESCASRGTCSCAAGTCAKATAAV